MMKAKISIVSTDNETTHQFLTMNEIRKDRNRLIVAYRTFLVSTLMALVYVVPQLVGIIVIRPQYQTMVSVVVVTLAITVLLSGLYILYLFWKQVRRNK